jgi:ADP-ribosylglycohydrolase
VETAVTAWKEAPVSSETVERLGGGWVAEEALAIGLYCALVAGGDFGKGVRLAVNHGGDSDSTGAVTGNLMGTLLGRGAIPERYLAGLELKEVIEEVAEDLFAGAEPAAT